MFIFMAWNSAIVHLAIELSIVCCGVTQDYNSSNCAEFRVTHLLPGTPLTVTEHSPLHQSSYTSYLGSASPPSHICPSQPN